MLVATRACFNQGVNCKPWAILWGACLLAMISIGCGGGGDGDNNAMPVTQIILPVDGSDVNDGDAIIFAGSCRDPEDGHLFGGALLWASDLDGELGTGATFATDTLSTGTHQVTLTGTDSKGGTGTATVRITVVPNAAPVAQINQPADGSIFDAGNTITFSGSGTDREDGNLSGTSLVWTSDIDGAIGTGISFASDSLSAGTHQITLTGTDAKGETGTALVTITINPGPPVKRWTHPAGLIDNISPDGGSTYSPQVAMDSNGNALVAWYQFDSTNQRIYLSEYRNNIWRHPVDLTDTISPDGQDAFSPQVAMDDAGNAMVVWEQSDGANSMIFISEYRSGVWTHPTDLSDNISPDGQDALMAQVAMDDAGNAMVVWEQSDGTTSRIFLSEYRNATWRHPVDLSDNISPDGGDAYNPQLAMDMAGDAVVAWEQLDGATSRIYMSEYRNNAWRHPADLTDNISMDGGGNAYQPQIAMDGIGNALVVWEQQDGAIRHIYMSEYRNATWRHPADLTDSISPNEGSAFSPKVAMDSTGNAVVGWRQWDGNNSQVFISEYRNDVWNHPLDLNDNISPDNQSAFIYDVAMDNAGNTIVVWTQDFDRDGHIFMSEYRNNTWRHPVDLSDHISPDGGDAGRPQVAMGGAENAIVVWRQYDGQNDQIFKSEYR